MTVDDGLLNSGEVVQGKLRDAKQRRIMIRDG